MTKLIKLFQRGLEPHCNIVFVHGLGDHAYRCWTNENGSFWPKMVAEDISGCAVWTLSYPAPKFGWSGSSLHLEDRAVSVLEALLSEQGFLDKPIVFICHSLGGLIVKQTIREAHDQGQKRPDALKLVNSTKAVIFAATPHSGSVYATLLDQMRLFLWPSNAAIDLVKNNAHLRNLNNWYRNFESGIKNRIYFETAGTHIGQIVDSESADAGLAGVVPIPIERNHMQVVKPADKTDIIHKSTVNFIMDTLEIAKGASSQDLRVENMPDIEGGISPALIPALARLAFVAVVALVLFLGTRELLWSDRTADSDQTLSLDLFDALVLVASITDGDSRIKAVETLVQRPLTGEEKAELLEISIDAAPLTVDDRELAAVEEARDTSELLAALGNVAEPQCDGEYSYRIKQGRIECTSGEPIRFISKPAAQGSREATELVVLHYTAASDANAVLAFVQAPSTRISYHVLISKDGKLTQMVDMDQAAIHTSNANRRSIGIAFDNAGLLNLNSDGSYRSSDGTVVSEQSVYTHTHDQGGISYWEKYTGAQISSAKALLQAIHEHYPEATIIGHSEFTPSRLDPGPALPIEDLRNQ